MNPCRARLLDLFGADPGAAVGVLQVAAVCRTKTGSLHAIRIGPGAPKSASDEFSLAAARARADAILTTGQILRDEPDLRHTLPGPMGPALAAWRKQELARPHPPRSVVLSSGRDLDLGHPVFATETPVVILTGEAGAAHLAGRAPAGATESSRIETVVRREPGPRDAIEWGREQSIEALLVEFGPSSATQLYEEPVLIDELLLSVYEEELAQEQVGAELGSEPWLEQKLGTPGPVRECIEESGRWSFRRYRREGP